MGFNRFVLNVIIRSILIAINAISFVVFFRSPDWAFTFIFLCLLFILQIILLIRYLTKINRDLANFLIHIKEQDSTLAFSKQNMDKIFRGVSQEFDKINQEIKKINSEKIKKQNLLNVVLNQVGTGILVLNSEDNIQIANNALKNLFDLKSIETEFVVQIKSIKPGDQRIESIKVNNITRKILITLAEIKDDNDNIKIYSFHDIDREITDYELQSWNGLIQVLSHEIMNTVTPISTVTETITECIRAENKLKTPTELNQKDINDTNRGISLIDNRIKNLSNVVEQLRRFSELTSPTIKSINTKSFLQSIIDIYQVQNPEIKFNLNIASDATQFYFDETLIELCVNNIIKNSIEAILHKNEGAITLRAYYSKNRPIIDIIDNGKGIDNSILEKVFLPFYTTKENGSGIGLSLTRQIMYSHGGTIEISSIPGETSVKLVFNN